MLPNYISSFHFLSGTPRIKRYSLIMKVVTLILRPSKNISTPTKRNIFHKMFRFHWSAFYCWTHLRLPKLTTQTSTFCAQGGKINKTRTTNFLHWWVVDERENTKLQKHLKYKLTFCSTKTVWTITLKKEIQLSEFEAWIRGTGECTAIAAGAEGVGEFWQTCFLFGFSLIWFCTICQSLFDQLEISIKLTGSWSLERSHDGQTFGHSGQPISGLSKQFSVIS